MEKINIEDGKELIFVLGEVISNEIAHRILSEIDPLHHKIQNWYPIYKITDDTIR